MDILVNNASALWWQAYRRHAREQVRLDSEHKRARRVLMTQTICVPIMVKNGWGRVVSMGPPLPRRHTQYKNKTAYYMSKCGMSMVALGVARKARGSLWKRAVAGDGDRVARVGELQLGSKKHWRKATILADCVVQLCGDEETNGQTLIDDEYLRRRGASTEDLKKYRFDKDVEPPRLLANDAERTTTGTCGGEASRRSGKTGRGVDCESCDAFRGVFRFAFLLTYARSTRVEARATHTLRPRRHTRDNCTFLKIRNHPILNIFTIGHSSPQSSRARRRRRVVLVHDARERVLSPRRRRGLGPRVPGRPVRPRVGRESRAKTRFRFSDSLATSVSASIRVGRVG